MNYKKLLTTFLLQILAVGSYFFLIRPIRGWYSSFNLESVFYSVREWPEYLKEITLDGLTVNFYYINGGNELVYSYAPQFGFFFLLAVVGLIFFKAPVRLYLFLSLFHLIAEILALAGTYSGLKGILAGFITADFILLYLSPLVSLGFILIAHQLHKRSRAINNF